MCSHVVKWGHWGVGGAAELAYTHPEFSFCGLRLHEILWHLFFFTHILNLSWTKPDWKTF